MSSSGNRRPLVFLVWPDEFPRDSVRVDLDRPERDFLFIRRRDRGSWQKLRGVRRGTVVLDPCCHAYGELLSLLEARGMRIIVGRQECRDYLQVGAAQP